MGIGQTRGGLDLGVRRLGAAETDVVREAQREKEWILRHKPDLPTERALGHRTHIDTVDPHGAARNIVEARHQVDQRRLPGPGRPDEGNCAPGCDVQLDVA